MIARFLLIFLTISALLAQAQDRKLILIGIDGLGEFGIKNNRTPVIDSLIKHGVYSLEAKAVMPTLSSPNWASIIMGVPTKDHEIGSNQWRREDIKNKIYCGGEMGQTYPTIFKVIRMEKPEYKQAIFHHWKEFERLVEEDSLIYRLHSKDAVYLIQEAAEFININSPDFTFIHLDMVDHAGHHYGLKSQQYTEAVWEADSLIGKLIQSLERRGEYTILITADHGFRGKHHGGFGARLRNIPWVLTGPDIKQNYEIPYRIDTYDTAPTVAFLLGITPLSCWKGKVLQGLKQ